MTFRACGMYDKKNAAVLTVFKSPKEGSKYFGIDVP
jgi:hypothetical protein